MNLFAALEVARGHVYGKTTEQEKREDFRRFLDGVVSELPPDREIHVILDHYCTHKRNQDWLAKHAVRVQFHRCITQSCSINRLPPPVAGLSTMAVSELCQTSFLGENCAKILGPSDQ